MNAEKVNGMARFMIAIFCLTSVSFAESGKDIPDVKNLGAIWFIGDSITQSNADGDPEGSPRKSLYDILKAEGCNFTYTGHHDKNKDGLKSPGNGAYYYHSGISGVMIDGIRGGLNNMWVQGSLKGVKPNIILIMLGTNDIGRDHKRNEAPDRLKALVDEIYALPDAGNPKIFLASIPPNLRNAEQGQWVVDFNKSIPGIVAGFKAKGKDVYFVDQFTPLNSNPESTMKDSLHPSKAGNDLMGKQWFEAIKASFENPKAENRK